jgi:hypothetical protein
MEMSGLGVAACLVAYLLPVRPRKLASAANRAAADAQLFGCQSLFDTRRGAQELGSVGLQLIDILEAGVGIEPAYTALQAAALTSKSIRCVRSTPGLTPRSQYYACAFSNTPWADSTQCSCRNLAYRNEAEQSIRKTPTAAMRGEEAWLSCLSVLRHTCSSKSDLQSVITGR